MSRDQRTVFGMDAEAYDRLRPRYPASLLAAVATVTGIGPDGTVLEVGAGTGKATRAMAELGWRVTCLEPSPEMSRLLKASCAGYPAVTVSSDYLETFPGGERFRLIIAAQSWHWTDPAVRYQRAHELLAPGGWLALAWNTPRRTDRNLDADLDRIYQEHTDGLRAREPGAAGVHRGQWSSTDLTANPLFGVVLHWRHDWTESYNAERYSQLLATQSDHMMMEPGDLAGLVSAIRRLVADRGDRVTLTYASDLFLAQRAP